MLVILRKIPSTTLYEDIVEFVEPSLKAKWFQKKVFIEDVKILQITDKDKETIEHHGLIRLNPDSRAIKIIKLLNRKPILGKRIAVSEYKYRAWSNDSRSRLDKNLAKKMSRRKGSRRRPNLETIIDNAITFTSNKSFHRTYSA